MWMKIVRYVVVAARATGLDKKIKDWAMKRVLKAREKAMDKLDLADAVEDEFHGE